MGPLSTERLKLELYPEEEENQRKYSHRLQLFDLVCLKSHIRLGKTAAPNHQTLSLVITVVIPVTYPKRPNSVAVNIPDRKPCIRTEYI